MNQLVLDFVAAEVKDFDLPRWRGYNTADWFPLAGHFRLWVMEHRKSEHERLQFYEWNIRAAFEHVAAHHPMPEEGEVCCCSASTQDPINLII